MGTIRLTGRDVEDLLAGRRPVPRAPAEDDTGDLAELAALVAVLHASRELEPAPPMSPELRDQIDGGAPGIRRRAVGGGYRRPVMSLAAALVLLVGIVVTLSRPGADAPSGDPTTRVGSPSGGGLRPPDPAKRESSSTPGGSEIVPAPTTTSGATPSTAPPGSLPPTSSSPTAAATGADAVSSGDGTIAVDGSSPDGDRDGDADGRGGGAGTGPQTGPVGGSGAPAPRPPDSPFAAPVDEGTTTTVPDGGSSTTSSTSTTTPSSAPPTSVEPRGDGEPVTPPSTWPDDDDGWDGSDDDPWYGDDGPGSTWEWFFGHR